ncbi:hypothetical protein ZIOFF_051216 [Zingiber officinale]|uniref:Uncharacterized protein n=1 Tax=Zingiber officinale TaxID=94328 RepID=A0A8J5FS99_ZINOF|nr:hypothetical protein ZIOFF_051216 [Zingiber officinale]
MYNLQGVSGQNLVKANGLVVVALERPRVTNKCSRCNNKLDFGDEYVCCTDCSDPYLMDKSSKFGFCKTGAELAIQLKPQEIFKWVAGPWMKCSSPCDGGIRYRDVGCYGGITDSSIKHYPVDDSRCPGQEMPARQEVCNLQSCIDLSASDSNEKSSGMLGWLVAFLVLVVLVAIGAVGFAGYVYYKRPALRTAGDPQRQVALSISCWKDILEQD